MKRFELSLLEMEYGNFDNALNAIKNMAENGDEDFQSLLADIYHYGIGTEKNEQESLRLRQLFSKNH